MPSLFRTLPVPPRFDRVLPNSTPLLVAWFESIVRELGNPPLCEVVLGLRAGDHTVIVNDVAEAEDILLRRTTEFDRSDLTLALFSCVAPTAQIATATGKFPSSSFLFFFFFLPPISLPFAFRSIKLE